jgi:excisionase family DNA binding protein
MLATPREVAEALGLSVHTVRRAIRDGRIPAVRPLGGRTVRVRLDDVLRIIQSLKTEN